MTDHAAAAQALLDWLTDRAEKLTDEGFPNGAAGHWAWAAAVEALLAERSEVRSPPQAVVGPTEEERAAADRLMTAAQAGRISGEDLQMIFDARWVAPAAAGMIFKGWMRDNLAYGTTDFRGASRPPDREDAEGWLPIYTPAPLPTSESPGPGGQRIFPSSMIRELAGQDNVEIEVGAATVVVIGASAESQRRIASWWDAVRAYGSNLTFKDRL